MKREKHSRPKISIITVVYNGERHLEQTIRSVIRQTYKDFEYIIIDGGSKDNTLSIIKKYAKHIDSWISEPDKGIYDAMNKGIGKAKGDFLYFLNSDDYLHDKEVLKVVANHFREDIDCVFGDFIYVYPTHKEYRPQKKGLKRLRQGIPILHQSLFMRKALIKKAGCFDTKYRIAADIDLECKTMTESNSTYIPRPICVFRYGGESSQLAKMRKEVTGILMAKYGLWNAGTYVFVIRTKIRQKLELLNLISSFRKLRKTFFGIDYR